jgi:hypothetical protein
MLLSYLGGHWVPLRGTHLPHTPCPLEVSVGDIGAGLWSAPPFGVLLSNTPSPHTPCYVGPLGP